MTWTEVCADPSLQDLPYKIELNEFGQIVMSPASNNHRRRQTRVGPLLLDLIPDGEILNECSIDTRLGVKVADVVWQSAAYILRFEDMTPYPQAPEICIEVISPSNSKVEMAMKRALYFEQGALEVWICDADRHVRFFAPSGEIGRSILIPGFPEIV